MPINVYIEKIFTILWFWLFILTGLNVYTFCKWLHFYISLNARLNFAYAKSLNVTVSGLISAAAAATPLNGSIGQTNQGNGSTQASTKLSTKYSPAKTSLNIIEDDYHTKIHRLFWSSTNGRIYNENIVKNYLVHDRMFILKLIADNTNEIIAKELVTLSVESLNKRCLNNENTV